MASLRGLAVGAVCLAQLIAGLNGAFGTSMTLRHFREQLDRREAEESNVLVARDLQDLYPARTIQVPVDHFHNDTLYEPHSNDTFALRYWFDASHYKKGGPVIVLQGGETSGLGRLPFLQKGIVAQLAQATQGLGVILEHRYYGESYPTPDFSTENLRFLTTDQALADMAYFAEHVEFEGLEHLDLTASKTPYIAYGGSYAGAFVAFLRKLYPHVYWGAISSSGVPEAIYDYWQYYEAARLFAPQDCVVATQKLTHMVDNILTDKADTDYAQRLKTAFGLGNLTRNDDFAFTISAGIAGLQGLNWDPALNDTEFGHYCYNISSTALLYPSETKLESEARDLLEAGGYGNEADTLAKQLLNYIGYVNTTVVQTCDNNRTQDSCFTSYNSTFYQQDNLKQDWRLWAYQYCFEWGYLQSGSGVPADQLPLISRLIDIDFLSVVCREAFDITTPSQVERINKHGGVYISYPRLAHIDGEWDPWRYASPHRIGLPERKSTLSEPFILIDDAVHHWDENGLFPNETRPGLPPKPVVEAQRAQVKFVKAWVKEWKRERCTKSKRCCA
ncbi:serine carboxypeptidase S28-domain-containing protein [Chaetomidium leptoderma]|uniref:Serine carboxypeptidase S28-domain-containing protein n=1 Tax=Chaetomidium leptoderma TaxID=669021 RepID=A0AAN6VIT1_9PEZI|nr:serine carboxypeptidase S28-domain-containing protein [Chaetomidium leptoderma]